MVKIKNKNFSLEQICESGQCFRFRALDDKKYGVTAFGRYLELGQEGDEITFYCTEEEYGAVWAPYFDMDTDYGRVIETVGKDDEYLCRAAQYGSGIRILRQDIWEVVISFIISQQNHIKRIRNCVETLCERYGEKKSYNGGVYYCFPTPEALARAAEEDLRGCNLGYRSRYIRETARSVMNGEINLDALREKSYEEAGEELRKLSGVGVKVADCVCLFGLHKVDAFPVDTHIRQVLDKQYPQGFPFKRYEGCAGIIQQYIFYYDLFH